MFNNIGRKIKLGEWYPKDIINKIFKESPARITNILLALSFVASTANIILSAIYKRGPLSFETNIYYIISFVECALIIIYTSYYFETDRTQILLPIAFIIMAATTIPAFINNFKFLYNYSYNIGFTAATIAINIFIFLTFCFTAFSTFKKFKWIIITEVLYSIMFLFYLYPIFQFFSQIHIYIQNRLAARIIAHDLFSIAANLLFTAGILLFFLLNISKLGKNSRASATVDTQKLE